MYFQDEVVIYFFSKRRSEVKVLISVPFMPGVLIPFWGSNYGSYNHKVNSRTITPILIFLIVHLYFIGPKGKKVISGPLRSAENKIYKLFIILFFFL